MKIKEWVDGHDPGALVIPFSGGLESSLQEMSEEEMLKYCTEHKTQRLISIQSPHTLLSAVSSVHTLIACADRIINGRVITIIKQRIPLLIEQLSQRVFL